MDVRTAGSAKPLNRLPTPDSVNFRKIAWIYAIGVIGYHLVALLAFYVLPRGGRRKRPPRT